MRQFLCLCFLIVIFGVTCYVVFFNPDDPNQIPFVTSYDETLTFWSSDFHVR